MKQKVFKNIEALIKIKDFKKSDFEKQIGVSCGYLSRRKDLPLSLLEKIAEIFDVKITQLFEDDFYIKYLLKDIPDTLEEKYIKWGTSSGECYDQLVELWECVLQVAAYKLHCLKPELTEGENNECTD